MSLFCRWAGPRSWRKPRLVTTMCTCTMRRDILQWRESWREVKIHPQSSLLSLLSSTIRWEFCLPNISDFTKDCLSKVFFFNLGCLQGPVDQLWALGPHRVSAGFLRGFFFKVKTLGLTVSRVALKKENPTILKPYLSKTKLFSRFYDSQSTLYVLLVQERVSSKLFCSINLFYLLHLSSNFIFLLGLHLRIFFSPCLSQLPTV